MIDVGGIEQTKRPKDELNGGIPKWCRKQERSGCLKAPSSLRFAGAVQNVTL